MARNNVVRLVVPVLVVPRTTIIYHTGTYRYLLYDVACLHTALYIVLYDTGTYRYGNGLRRQLRVLYCID